MVFLYRLPFTLLFSASALPSSPSSFSSSSSLPLPSHLPDYTCPSDAATAAQALRTLPGPGEGGNAPKRAQCSLSAAAAEAEAALVAHALPQASAGASAPAPSSSLFLTLHVSGEGPRRAHRGRACWRARGACGRARALLRGLRRLAADPEAVRQLGGRAGAVEGFARAGCAGEVREAAAAA